MNESSVRASSNGPRGKQLGEFAVATLHEATGQKGNLPGGIKPIKAGWTLNGPAYPVSCAPRDNLWLHRAIYAAPEGVVLVVETGGYHEAGYWGEIMTSAAVERRLAGLVLDGCVRDKLQVTDMGFPIFARGLNVLGTGKDPHARGSLNQPIRVGRTLVRDGDWVVGDDDGVVIINQEDIEQVLESARARIDKEHDVMERIHRGESTLDIYRLPGYDL